MNKPFTLKVEDLRQNIIDSINEAELPAYCIKEVLQKIYEDINNIDKQEIEKYQNGGEKENDI